MALTEIVRSSRSARVNFSQDLWTHQQDQPERLIRLPRREKEIRSAATARLEPVQQDKTAKFIVAGVGGMLVLFIMIFLFTDKAKPPQRPKAQAPGSAHLESKPENTAASIVPDVSMKPNPEDSKKSGQLSSTDIERTKDVKEQNYASAAQLTQHPIAQNAQHGDSLAQVQPFQANPPDWTPPPYQEASTAPAAAVDPGDSALAKASLVFTLNRDDRSSTAAETGSQAAPTFDLGTGNRLSARLASVVTTAVQQPVVAIIEYNYERDGQIVVPAGSKAIGSVTQGDRSGYIQLKFDHLEFPGGGSATIDAIATDTSLGPLKGKVTGTHQGRNVAVRSLTGIGSVAAMALGQSNASGAFSEADMIRMQTASNVGRAGDEEVMRLNMTEHPIVTLPAGLRIYVVFEKASHPRSSGGLPGQITPGGEVSH